MIVYIEQVILDNMVINYFLLWFLSVLLKQKSNVLRFFLASLTGTCFAILFPLLKLNLLLLIFLKVMLCVLIILVAFPYKNLKNLFVFCVSFFILTFLLGGVVFGLLLNILSDYKILNGTFSYNLKVPISVFVLVGFLFFKAFYDLVFFAKNKLNLDKITFELSVLYHENTAKIKAFLDTGNLLLDSKTNMPVIVINFKAFRQITKIKTKQFLMGEYTLKNKRYQKFFTANKTSNMLLFEVDKVALKYRGETMVIKQAVLGLSNSNFSLNLNCDALIGMKIFEVGETSV